MVKLRLMRLGRKKRPHYRIVAVDVNAPRNGSTLAQVGLYDPLAASVNIDTEKAIDWLNRGAQMTPTVRSLMSSQGVLARWQGLESTIKEGALLGEKPKRQRKLAASAKAAATAESEVPTEAEVPTEVEETSEAAAPVDAVQEAAEQTDPADATDVDTT